MYPNIDVHIRRLIADFSIDGEKCIAELQSHFSNITFTEKSRYGRIFQQAYIKEGNLQ